MSAKLVTNNVKSRIMKKLKNTIIIFISVTVLSGCASSFYDHYTFTETLSTKAKAEHLIQKSNTPYSDNISLIDDLKVQLQTMVAYERAKEKNQITLKMWEYLNRDNSALHQFLNTWENQGTMSTVFVEQFSPQISKAFDLMIDYENKKSKASGNAITSFLSNL